MTRLHHRVRKLEASKVAGALVRSWTGMFGEVGQFAFSKLTASDQGVVEAITARRFGSPELNREGEIWKRWEVVFASAITELGCPLAISANDLLL